MIRRLLANAAALAVATYLLHGITVAGQTLAAKSASLLAVALVLGILNALVRPAIKLITTPVILLTLGLFLVVINAAMLMLTSWVCAHLGVGFAVDGWPTAILGALVVSVVSGAVAFLIKDRGE